ncbi:MAG: protein translocase subunit SecF, partial [Candidatus Binatia bacterium]
MEIIPHDTKFDFISWRKPLVMVSLVLNVLALLLLVVKGPNLGIDFAGGSLVQVRFSDATPTDAIRSALSGLDFGALDIQDLGGASKEFLVRVPLTGDNAEGVNKQVTATLAEKFGAGNVEVMRVEAVGPRVGRDLRQKAILAVVFATLMMGVYIWIRFEWRFGLGAAVALIHDVLLAIGALVLFNYEFDLTIVAALLTIVGFSVNDTVIVSDRIRENRTKDRRSSLASIINRSINETLSRTVLTTGTAIMVVLSLFTLGGVVIHGFAFTLLVGFVVGTYSSIFISSPIVLFFEPATAAPAAERRAAAAPAARR